MQYLTVSAALAAAREATADPAVSAEQDVEEESSLLPGPGTRIREGGATAGQVHVAVDNVFYANSADFYYI